MAFQPEEGLFESQEGEKMRSLPEPFQVIASSPDVLMGIVQV